MLLSGHPLAEEPSKPRVSSVFSYPQQAKETIAISMRRRISFPFYFLSFIYLLYKYIYFLEIFN